MGLAARSRHPKKEIEEALRYAEERGCTVEKAGGSSHASGRLYAPDEESIMSIWSTPRSAENHAKQIGRFADRHGEEP